MSGDVRVGPFNKDAKYVKLNVGGTLFTTTVQTLTKCDTMLRAMFTGSLDVIMDREGWVLIDRCGKHFGTILNFLRDGTVVLPESKRELLELLQEANFYCAKELVAAIDTQLKQVEERQAKDDVLAEAHKIPLLTKPEQEQAIVAHTKKPIVKFSCNRHNNKYSYTNNSDENFLRNTELFEKLCLWYCGRVVFLKDVLSKNEICCWSFYGNSQKISEVCCTSIVYGTDKKHTKVEFPESRIMEEMLRCLVYENPAKQPDGDVMQATNAHSGAATFSGGASSLSGGLQLAPGCTAGGTYHSDGEDDDGPPPAAQPTGSASGRIAGSRERERDRGRRSWLGSSTQRSEHA